MIKAFVIGHPIAHSRSPIIHEYWLSAYAIDGSYEAIDVAPEQLPAHFERLRHGEWAGGNVTIPLKELVFALCDTVDPLARQIGAVNTLIAKGGKVHGTNTDYLGFLADLDQRVPGWSDNLEHAVVLGAGGAARAILVALSSRGIKHVHVLNRTEDKAFAVAAELAGPVIAHHLPAFAHLAPMAGLVVNTTSIGMHGTAFHDLPLAGLHKDAIVADIVYTPLETPLLADAKALGLRTIDGLGMLLHQAVPGFEAWFGRRPAVTEDLRRTVLAALGA